MLSELNGCLVVTRKVGQAIEVSLDSKVIVRIGVTRIQGGRVTLETAANRELKILRTELKLKGRPTLKRRVRERKKKHVAE